MQRPLQISFHGMEHSDALERRVREKATELERFYDHITGCHVTLEAPHRRHHQGNLYVVRIDIRVPGKEIVVSREPGDDHAHEDGYVVIRDAFDAAVRQLEDYARKRRGKVKRHELPDHGTIVKLFRHSGYGFVEMAGGLEVYFHENAVANDAFPSLQVGDEVRIVVVEGESEKGPQASSVTPIGKHHLVGDVGS